jgi:hypothetical protein
MKPLRCPYCGSTITAVLVYTGHGYSEHRDLDGYECDDWDDCLAEWDKWGEPTVDSRLNRRDL